MTAAYVDPSDGRLFALDQPRWCGPDGAPLRITPGPGITPDEIDGTLRSHWRYRAALPLALGDPITLGEGCTPLVRAPFAEASPHFKLEWFAPTGSFKDRGASVMLSALRAQGVRSAIEDSSGNGGAAVAAYGRAGDLAVTVFAPDSTSPGKLAQSRAHGARIELVPGPREASQAAAIAAAERGEGTYASHNWQAWFLEGTKLLAYELWEDFGFTAPDAIVMPVGAGSLLLGLERGFSELVAAGQLARSPRLYAAQPRNCSPVDAALLGEGERPVLPTVAEGTAIRQPVRLPELVSAVRSTGGASVAVPEEAIRQARGDLALRGFFVEPTSATAAAGFAELLRRGEIRPDETTVVVLTGSGLKSPAA